jgi:carbamoyl-phosphate synthase large subunit
MPRRHDIKSILLLGAGPIVIGQACEFDYSGTQAVTALRQEGYRVILVNSNPATIMTDPDMADATYIEPLHWRVVARIIELERPDAILPTMGGQTALNCALDLEREGILGQYNVEMIGASRAAIDTAEDRSLFCKAMQRIGIAVPRSAIAHDLEQALAVQVDIGFPVIIRPSFTLGGSGGGIAYNREEFVEICQRGLELSPTTELLIDESLIGWKEYELEVVRDKKDNCIIVCAIENFDPLGVHTGDSITVAPAQTLSDKEYQKMRNAALAVVREVGVETGGSNVQFALNPGNGDMVVIEMNPRVSRSSALASKATGFPIAKIAAKLAIGYTLDELRNEITHGLMPASFEPSIDYVVTKIPRFNFDKFPQAEDRLTTQMKSVGEVMAVGRNFCESLQKAIRSLETGKTGFNPLYSPQAGDTTSLRGLLRIPSSQRLWYLADAMREGLPITEIHQLSGIDTWFLQQIKHLVDQEQALSQRPMQSLTAEQWRALKRLGFADARLAQLWQVEVTEVRDRRISLGVTPVYKRIDSCAAEFPSPTAYMYSTYELHCEARPTTAPKIMILGGGPNRIGQGIEFDYCCVHAVLAIRDAGYETIMINCNPETVSTDYDTADRLYFEPVTVEDILAIVAIEQPQGVIVHYGGQTPLNIAQELSELGVKIIGTTPEAIHRAEDREQFQQMIQTLGLKQPPNGIAHSIQAAVQVAAEIGYPLVVRPSFVLGGRDMKIIHSAAEMELYLARSTITTAKPLLLDHFLVDAIEVDVDAVCDGEDVLIGGIMEHIEQAGIHSGDSSCTLPPFSLGVVLQEALRRQVKQMALELGVVGLLNAQFAIQGDDIYVLEVNPRASRTVPFVSKATGLPLAKIAARAKLGERIKAQGYDAVVPTFYSVKHPVFPFTRFAGVDVILGPEMKSTGESMGIGDRFGQAFAKAKLAASANIKRRLKAFVSVRDNDKVNVAEIAKRLVVLGFEVYATRGTARVIEAAMIPCRRINKVNEGRPHIVDMIKNDEIDFIVNTTDSQKAMQDSFIIRSSALQHDVSYTTTIAGARATCLAMQYEDLTTVTKIQDRLNYEPNTNDCHRRETTT